MLDHREAPVAEDLRPFLSRIAARRLIDGNENIIHVSRSILQHAAHEGMARPRAQIFFSPRETGKKLQGARARNADDRQRAWGGRRGECDNGVFMGHDHGRKG